MKCNIQYATKSQLDKVNKRIKNMSGFSKTLNSIIKHIDNYNINTIMLNNEIKTLHKRIDNIEKKILRNFQDKKKGDDE